MRLHAEDVPFPVAQGRDVEGRPARVPRVSGVLPAVVDEPEHDLIVVDELLQEPLLALCRKQEFAFGMGGDERDDLAYLEGPGEGAGTAVLQAKQAGTALVVARVIRREHRLGLGRHHAAQGRQEARLDQDLKSVAHAEHRLARFHEPDQVFR